MDPIYIAAEADYAKLLKAEGKEEIEIAESCSRCHPRPHFSAPLTPAHPGIGAGRRRVDFSTKRRSSLIGSGLSST